MRIKLRVVTDGARRLTRLAYLASFFSGGLSTALLLYRATFFLGSGLLTRCFFLCSHDYSSDCG